MRIDPRLGLSPPVMEPPDESKVVRLMTIGVAIVVILFMLSSLLLSSSGFRTSPPWLYTSLLISMLVALTAYIAILRTPPPFGMRAERRVVVHLLVFVGAILFFGGFTWNAIGTTLPSIATRYWGVESERSVQFLKRKTSRKNCSYQLIMRIDAGDTGTYCADFSLFETLPERGTLRVTLHKTWFGVHIGAVHSLEN